MIMLKKLAAERVDITEQDLKEAFVRNYGSRVKARMIMFDNQRRAQEGWDLLDKNPEEFESAGAKLSIDPPVLGVSGGQLPYRRRKFTGNETLKCVRIQTHAANW